ncbi:MAG: winged helix-turn-helix transcriptional regulator [Leptospiraceae bacterium]|nr:winged helix-turn-helix transcriptional regulator [Leptospiraceae bacterium]
MAINKKHEFQEDLIDLAEFAKVISHPARIAILITIAERGTCICGEIVEVLPLAQSTVSQHLKELKNFGLISGEIEGTKSCYCINWENLEKYLNLFQNEFNKINNLKEKFNNNCC